MEQGKLHPELQNILSHTGHHTHKCWNPSNFFEEKKSINPHSWLWCEVPSLPALNSESSSAQLWICINCLSAWTGPTTKNQDPIIEKTHFRGCFEKTFKTASCSSIANLRLFGKTKNNGISLQRKYFPLCNSFRIGKLKVVFLTHTFRFDFYSKDRYPSAAWVIFYPGAQPINVFNVNKYEVAPETEMREKLKSRKENWHSRLFTIWCWLFLA